jgi:hypothetical protein
MDISNFYLMTPLHHPEFIQIKLSDIPEEVIKEYKLRDQPPKTEASTTEPSAAFTASLKQDYWPTKMSQQTQIPTKQIGTWTLEAQHKTYTVHTGY